MASTFENNLRLEEIGTGEQSGTWGTKTNVNLELITDGLSYSSTGEAIANAAAHTITMADGVADEFRSFYLKCTGGGQACTVTLAPNTLSKVWVIENTTSYTLTFSQGSGANVAILAGQVKMIATDGAGSGAAMAPSFTSSPASNDSIRFPLSKPPFHSLKSKGTSTIQPSTQSSHQCDENTINSN